MCIALRDFGGKRFISNVFIIIYYYSRKNRHEKIKTHIETEIGNVEDFASDIKHVNEE